jgi:hypothetical protein
MPDMVTPQGSHQKEEQLVPSEHRVQKTAAGQPDTWYIRRNYPCPRGYQTDMRYRGSIAKWIILAFALLITLLVFADRIAAYGSVASGLWIAFAVLHAGDRLAATKQP